MFYILFPNGRIATNDNRIGLKVCGDPRRQGVTRDVTILFFFSGDDVCLYTLGPREFVKISRRGRSEPRSRCSLHRSVVIATGFDRCVLTSHKRYHRVMRWKNTRFSTGSLGHSYRAGSLVIRNSNNFENRFETSVTRGITRPSMTSRKTTVEHRTKNLDLK